jgi:hypothetical protein
VLVDDGTNGDAVAGDQLFSGTTRFRVPKKKSTTSLAAGITATPVDSGVPSATYTFTIPVVR